MTTRLKDIAEIFRYERMLESAEEHLEADNGLQHDAVMNEKEKKHSQNLQEKNRLMRILEKEFGNDNPLQKAQIDSKI